MKSKTPLSVRLQRIAWCGAGIAKERRTIGTVAPRGALTMGGCVMTIAKDASVRARAWVTVTLEVAVPDVWGADCTVGQIVGQARDGAVDLMRKAITGPVRVVNIGKVDVRLVEE